MVEIIEGDCLEVMRSLESNTIDGVVTDPPYGLGVIKDIEGLLRDWLEGGDGGDHVGAAGFMGRNWDRTVPPPILWREMLRVMKPGAYALVFSGTRTQDLMGLSLRLAGFEICGGFDWVFGAGFPKGLDVGKKCKQWDGYRTQLKPAHEPIIIARKPLDGTVVENVRRWGCGAFNIDGSRIGTDWETETGNCNGRIKRGPKNKHVFGDFSGVKSGELSWMPNPTGRYPADILLTHAHDCEPGGDCGVSCPVRIMGEQSGVSVSKANVVSDGRGAPERKTYNKGVPGEHRPENSHSDTGTAARYFWQCYPDPPAPFLYQGKATKRDRTCNGAVSNTHPTVKPRALIKYLINLIMPPSPDAVILDPFGGSGTAAVACAELGRQCIVIERDPDYVAIARDRVAATARPVALPNEVRSTKPTLEERVEALEFQQRGLAAKVRRIEASGQLSLFG